MSTADVTPATTNVSVAEPGWPPAVIAGAFQLAFSASGRSSAVVSVWRRSIRIRVNRGSDRLTARHCGAQSRCRIRRLGAIHGRPCGFDGRPASAHFELRSVRHRHALTTPTSCNRITSSRRPAGCRDFWPTSKASIDLAARNGMPMPRTEDSAAREAEIIRLARDMHYPCLLKPTHFRQWQDFRAAIRWHFRKWRSRKTPTELIDRYRQAAHGQSARHPAGDHPGTRHQQARLSRLLRRATAARIGHAMFRELRCDPIGFGPATVSHPVDDPEPDQACATSSCAAIGYVGICEIEMKWDDRDGRVKLIEANPRLSGGGDAAPYAGVDLCWIHYLDLIGQLVVPVSPRTDDFRHIVLRPEGDAPCAAYWRAGMLLTWKDVRLSYKRPLAFFDLDPRDWRYSLETLFIAGRSFLSEALRKQRMSRAVVDRSAIAGHRALVLENRHLRAAIVPALGGRVWTLDDLVRQRQWIWHRAGVPLVASALRRRCMTRSWAGGWEELFPNDAAGRFEGRDLPDHGEWWTMAWESTQHSDDQSARVRMTAQATIIKAECMKEFNLEHDASSLTVCCTSIRSLEPAPFHFLFKQHLPVRISPACDLVLPGGRVEPVDPSFGTILSIRRRATGRAVAICARSAGVQPRPRVRLRPRSAGVLVRRRRSRSQGVAADGIRR